MALITSAQSGNFNQSSTWTGGVIPGVGDEARASTGHTVTITANATCDEISNAGTGKFVVNDGVTLTANVTNKSATANAYLLEFQAASPATATIVGNCIGGTVTGSEPVRNISSGTLNITGNVSGGSGAVSYIQNISTGIINVTGNVLGGASGSTSGGIVNASTGTINITGNCTAGNGSLTIAVRNSSTGTVNITGNVTANGNAGALNNSTGTLSVIGTIQSSQTAAGVAGTSPQQVTVLSGPFLTETVRGVAPVYCAAWRWNASPSNSTYMEVMTNNLLVKRNLVTDDNVTGMPAVTNVRSGTIYGPTSSLQGTLVVPPAGSVSLGVPVDNTTGTAVLTPEAVWSHATRTITGGSVDTLVNAPTVPSASAIASQVRTELTTELNRIDAAISTRATPANVPTSDITAIKTKTDALNTTRLGQVATTEIVGNLLAQANS